MPDENLHGLLAEMDAQGAAERAVEGTGSPVEALLAIEGALGLAEAPGGLADRVCLAAMKSILGQPIDNEAGDPVAEPLEAHLFESLALVWLGWMQGRDGFLPTLQRLEHLRKSTPREGAIHQMALFYWLDALRCLLIGRREESRRLWKRALGIGSSFGTDSHPALLWTYIATFWPHEAQEAPGHSTQKPTLLTSAG